MNAPDAGRLGRLGRLLIALFLVEQQVLREPLLYLSLYLKTHRADYYPPRYTQVWPQVADDRISRLHSMS